MILDQHVGEGRNLLPDRGQVADLQRQVEALTLRVTALEHEIQDLLTDRVYSSPDFPVLTRPGVERRWRRHEAAYDALIFMDLDDLREVNARYGYDGANRRIAAGLNVRDTAVVCGRWFSGDEIVYLCNRADAPGLARRLQRELVAQGLSATFGIVPAGDELEAAVSRAADLVQAAKARNERGRIYLGQGIPDSE